MFPRASVRAVAALLSVFALGACSSLTDSVMNTVAGKVQLACPPQNIVADA